MKKNRERLEGDKKSLLLGIHENTEIIVLRGVIKIFHNRLQRIYATLCHFPTYSSLPNKISKGLSQSLENFPPIS